MTKSKPNASWPEEDDRLVVEEMLRDPQSEQWYDCYLYINKLVHVNAKNIPRDYWDDITQDAMVRVHRYLPSFQYYCSFRTWLFGIVRSCIIDHYRKSSHAGQHTTSFSDPNDDVEREENAFLAAPEIVRDESVIQDELNLALIALQEYVSIHADQARNRRILDMVLFEGRSLEEAAKAAECSAAVAGYIVRSAQRYVRENLANQRASKTPLAPDPSSAYREKGRTYEQLAEQTLEDLKRRAEECYTTAKELGVE